MKKICIIICTLLTAAMMTACEPKRIMYRNSMYALDYNNMDIAVKEGYILSQGHSYDIMETENGYNLIFYFEKIDNESEELTNE